MRIRHSKEIICALLGSVLIITIYRFFWKVEIRMTSQVLPNIDRQIYVKHVEFDAGENKLIRDKLAAKEHKKNHVTFLNLCGNRSAVLDSIFVRFGANNNLSVSLYATAAITDRTNLLSAQKYKSNVTYDIVSFPSLQTYPSRFIQNDTVRLTLLENPVNRFSNNVMNKKRGDTGSDKSNTSAKSNSIAESLGLDIKNGLNTEKDILFHLEKIRQKIGTVMLLERLKESLILLRRVLNWSLADILYIQNEENSIGSKISEKDFDRVQSQNVIDVKIYKHFVQTFEEQIKGMAGDFEEELNHFEIILTQLLGFCNQRNKPTEPFPIETSAWNEEIFIPWDKCAYYRLQ